MEIFWAIVAFAGPTVILGLFIWFMVAKKGWTWAPCIASGIFVLLVASGVPDLPRAMHDGVTGVIASFSSAK